MGGRSGGGISRNVQSKLGRFSGGFNSSGQSDSLEHRDPFEDSLTISYKVLLSTVSNKLDSTVNDFTKRFPIPATHIFLGNTGTATRSILFSPIMQSGWDHGFHAFDAYRWKPESVRFFNTTRPYTELTYLLGGRTEQIIGVTHTQNIKPNWNVLFQYRLINSPGFFKSQGANDNNYLLTSWYQSVNKRYNNYFVILGNALQSAENGGLKSDQDYLNDPVYNDRFNVPTELGGDVAFGRNFFTSKLNTGSRYNDGGLIITQQYDLGRKDSLVNDSTVTPLFYPRLRFEHTFKYSTYKFLFVDYLANPAYYKNNYLITIPASSDTVKAEDRWTELSNDFSIYQYPDEKNLQQFIKAGITIQNLKANTDSISESFYNMAVHGEYRNKTRNKKWDMIAVGMLYLNGFNAGDYHASIDLKRFSGKKNAYVELGFRNANRTPPFIYDTRSSFYFDVIKNFKKENITNLSASFYQPRFNVKFSANYFLVNNYTYFKNYYHAEQEEALFNVLQVSIEKKLYLTKHWIWNADLYFQQKTGNAPLNVPLIFTRNRIGYEGTLGFQRLNIAMGFEIRYHTPYLADGYSPILGKFYYQDSIRISNRPDVSAYLHFRIRNFRAFIRAENLNTVTITNGFGFRYHNFAAPNYPYPGLVIRQGIYWSFVN